MGTRFIPAISLQRRGSPPVLPLLRDKWAGPFALLSAAHVPEIHPVGSAWVVTALLNDAIRLGGDGTCWNRVNFALNVIDIGVSDYEIVAQVQFDANEPGLAARANADGSNHLKWNQDAGFATAQITQYTDQVTAGTVIRGSLALAINAAPAFNEVRWWLWRSGMYVKVNGVLWWRGASPLYKTNTFVGLSCRLLGGIYNNPFEVYATTGKTMSIIGDSIGTGFPVGLANQWNGAKVELLNHAVGGATVAADMATQVLAAAADDADVIISQLGTNDGTPSQQVKYQQGLVDMKASSPRAKIYAMGVLDRVSVPDADRVAKNVWIKAAALAAGVPYWETGGWIDPTIGVDTDDGTHPNGSGQAKINAKILALI